jgi:hypothetical protein
MEEWWGGGKVEGGDRKHTIDGYKIGLYSSVSRQQRDKTKMKS